MILKGNLSSAKASLIRKLHQRKHREQTGLFLAEGIRTVEQILDNRNIVTEFIVRRAGSTWEFNPISDSSTSITFSTSASTSIPLPLTPYTLHPKKLLSFFNSSISIYDADATLYNELSAVEHPQEIFSVCRIPQPADSPDLLKGTGVLLAMYMMSDPGNLGTVLRSAAWFGVRGVFLSTGTVDLYNPKVIRSMAGSVGSLPVATGYLAIFLEEAKKAGWGIYLLDAGEKSADLASIRPGKKSILVLGSEAHGLPDPIKSAYTCIKVETPDRRPSVESLNASVTASIALYQLSLKAGLRSGIEKRD